MMYGFGDDENPYTESVELLEDLVIQYVQNMVCKKFKIKNFQKPFVLWIFNCLRR
jgi:hypothetical protein